MLNISWGTKIALLYISFVVLILFMVMLSMSQKIDLVTEDYYNKELTFQNTINETNNANALPEQIQHEIVDNNFHVKFPEVFKGKEVKGTITFYKPSDKSKDFSEDIVLNENLVQKTDLKFFSRGMYKMKVSWSADNVNYFTEQIIVMP
jgi:hypothetical protein